MSQQSVRSLVLEYLSSRDDTAVSTRDGRMFSVSNLTDKATAEFGGRSTLYMTFDPAIRQYDASCEYISANHAFLEVIRNDLERPENGDVRVSEVYVATNADNAQGVPLPPDLKIRNVPPNAKAMTRYIPTGVFSYEVSIDGDLPLQYVIPVVISHDGKAIANVAERLYDNSVPLCGGRPENCLELANIGQLVTAAKKRVMMLVEDDAKQLAVELGATLVDERTRLVAEYERNVANQRNQVVVDEENNRRNQRIQDLEQKLRTAISIQLQSVLVVWWPEVEYQAQFISRKLGKFSMPVGKYSGLQDKLQQLSCKECGNRSKFTVCQSGKHLACDGDCSCSLKECDTCRDSFCAVHGRDCHSCDNAVCVHDSSECSYAEAHAKDAGFCPNCLATSFEEQAICEDCRKTCEKCERIFPAKLVCICRVCARQVCTSHKQEPDAHQCSECGDVACRDDGLVTEDRKWACTDHADTPTCCSRKFGLSRLEHCCVDSAEILCPDHRDNCLECHRNVCRDPAHQSNLRYHAEQVICRGCRKDCSLCDSNLYAYIKGDLDSCGLCKNDLCQDHKTQCEICKTTWMCHSHVSGLPACTSCGKHSCTLGQCGHQTARCRTCKMAYCANCLGIEGICTTCTSLMPELVNASATRVLIAASAKTDDLTAAVLKSYAERSDNLTLTTARNESFKVWRFSMQPAWWQFWKSKKSVRIVTLHGSNDVKEVTPEA